MTTNILDFWPIDSPPRPNQVKALEWMANQDAKYIILEAPVGSGKSLIGLTYSRWLSGQRGHSFIMTPQRILQEQYEQTYKSGEPNYGDIASLQGKSNYPCASKNATCDIGSIVKPKCSNCPFQNAVKRAKASPNTVLNYKLALLMFGYTEVFDPRSLMILDECHTVEEHLTEFNSISVNLRQTEKIGVKWQVKTNIDSAHKWMQETYLPKAEAYLKRWFNEDIEELLDKSGTELTRKEIKSIRDYNKFEEHIDDLAEFLCLPMEILHSEYVLVHDKEIMKFKQLKGAKNFKQMMKPMANKFLFMSSTILDYKGFCDDLGIDINDVAFLSVDSDFPVENRPVVYMPQMKMNASWNKPEQKKQREQMLETITKLCNLHEDDSGIIHTGNFQIAKWLVEELEHALPQQVLHHNPDSGDDRNAIIRQHMTERKPTLLISPSITEGLDLADDLSRFAIFVKIPFGFLGDQWIKKRLDMSQEWYQRRALIDIIQGAGRVVRSKEDWGQVYVLDQSWAYLYNSTKQIIPRWWRDGYQVL